MVLSDMTASVLCLIFQWSSSFSMLIRFFSFTSRSTAQDSRRFSSESFLQMQIFEALTSKDPNMIKIKTRFQPLQGDPSGQRFYFVDSDLGLAHMTCQFCHFCSGSSRIRHTSELQNQSQKNVVADLTGHPVNGTGFHSPLGAVLVGDLLLEVLDLLHRLPQLEARLVKLLHLNSLNVLIHSLTH